MAHSPLVPRCSGRLLRLGLYLGSVILALPLNATAQACLQDEYGKNTQCTANDVQIAQALAVYDPISGASILSCIAGQKFSFVADFKVVTTATARENIGMYFATNGQTSALTGQCADNIIAPLHDNPAYPRTSYPKAPQLGEPTYPLSSPGYEELDASPDNCGDISTSDNSQIIKVYVADALCKAGANGQVALPNCTSWQQPGGTTLCQADSKTWLYPFNQTTGAAEAIPGSPSKCNCNNLFTIPVQVQSPGIAVKKSCTIPGSTYTNATACNFTGETGTVTYNVSISNKSNFGTVVFDKICDSYYGALLGSASGCPTAQTPITNNTCSSLTSVSSTDVQCSFQASVQESASIPDTISVYGHGDSNTPITPNPTISNPVTVTSIEAPTTGLITTAFASNDQVCAKVTYNIDVANTSASGTDEILKLTDLADTTNGGIGDVTKTSANILTTSCTVSSSSPAAIPVGGPDYKCSFQTTFCATPANIVTTPGKCTAGSCSAGQSSSTSCTTDTDCNVTCNGIQQSVSLGGTAYGDEGPTDTASITITNGNQTVSECVQVSNH